MIQPNDIPAQPDSCTNTSVTDLIFSSKCRRVRLCVGIVLLAAGATGLAIPVLAGMPQWTWNLRTRDDLAGAEVNASIVPLDNGDYYLTRTAQRHISVISPPLAGLAPGRPLVEVIISRTNAAQPKGDPLATQRVILFWQTAPATPYRMEETSIQFAGDGSPARAVFMPPVDARSIHRIGVQTPEVGEIKILGISMVDAGLGDRVGFLMRSLSEAEMFGGESVNFYKGPNLLGEGVNYYMVSLCGIGLGLLLILSALGKGQLRIGPAILAVILPWILSDLCFSIQLTRRAAAEARTLRTQSERERIAAVYGDAAADAVEWLEVIPIGSRVCVLADDGVTTGHRLAYLAAPNVVLVARPADAEYIVLLGGGGKLVDDQTLQATGEEASVAVKVVARWRGGALLERARD